MGADQNFDWQGAAANLIDWWQEAGVDTLVDEAPRNWLATAAEAKAASALPNTVREAQIAATTAPVLPAMPDTLAAFEAWRQGPDAPEAQWPGQRIAAQGDAAARLMIIVDMPERDDADTGQLVSGAAGRLFDRMLAAIGQNRQSIYLVPMLQLRTATGRLPDGQEELLGAILRHHVGLAAPRRVLIFGNAPSRALIGAEAAASRGYLHKIYQDGGIKPLPVEAVASYHPRFLLERPAAKPEAWKDLQLLIRGIDS